MAISSEDLFTAALKLAAPERARLAELLLESISPETEATTDAEFLAELDRRRAALLANPGSGVPWTELVQEG